MFFCFDLEDRARLCAPIGRSFVQFNPSSLHLFCEILSRGKCCCKFSCDNTIYLRARRQKTFANVIRSFLPGAWFLLSPTFSVPFLCCFIFEIEFYRNLSCSLVRLCSALFLCLYVCVCGFCGLGCAAVGVDNPLLAHVQCDQ